MTQNKKEVKCRWKLADKKTFEAKNHAWVRSLAPQYEVCRVCGAARKAPQF